MLERLPVIRTPLDKGKISREAKYLYVIWDQHCVGKISLALLDERSSHAEMQATPNELVFGCNPHLPQRAGGTVEPMRFNYVAHIKLLA